jgi:hypothetical protein
MLINDELKEVFLRGTSLALLRDSEAFLELVLLELVQTFLNSLWLL